MKNTKQILIEQVLEQIIKDIEGQDLTAAAELLTFIDEKYLKGYLSEEEEL